jgi:type VI secretion system secreted protein Hcp
MVALVSLLTLALAACGDSPASTSSTSVTPDNTDEASRALLASNAIAKTGVKGQSPVYLTLKANGNTIQGESSVQSLNRANTIECIAFEQAVATAREAGSGLATGRRTYEPITCRKLIDKASPLLAKALVQNEVVEGTFRFYRPNPTGDGTTEQFYTIEIKKGRIGSLRQFVPDTQNGGQGVGSVLPQEEVTFVFDTIVWTYTNGGITYQDSSSTNR